MSFVLFSQTKRWIKTLVDLKYLITEKEKYRIFYFDEYVISENQIKKHCCFILTSCSYNNFIIDCVVLNKYCNVKHFLEFRNYT